MPFSRPLTALLLTAVLVPLWPRPAAGQTTVPLPLPLPKGTKYNVKIDSSPQQAAIYVNDKIYGIQGYTPTTLKLPKGPYRITLELPNFKPVTVPIEVTRSQAFTITLERAARPAVLDVRAASDQNAVGGTIVVDGTAVGTLPNRVELGAGNHVVEVTKPGFQSYRDNIQVAEGETRTIVVPLQPQMKPGSLLVTADVPNAMVFVDGIQKDSTPTVIVDLAEGAHTVEVRAPGLPPWKQVVMVVAGQQIKVVAPLAGAAAQAGGSLRVLCDAPNADVFLDGEAKGPAGSVIKNVEPGSHIVEVRASGFAPQRTNVDIVGGQIKTIHVDLLPAKEQTQNAGIHIITAVPDVDIFIDGASAGKAPVTRNDMTPGKHFVVARKTGFADFKLEVELQGGRTQEVMAELRSSGSVRVISNPAGATVILDGSPVGVTPLSLSDVPAGQHVVELKLKDYLDAKQVVSVEGGVPGIVQADLTLAQKGPSVGDLERQQRDQSSFSAMTLDRGRFTADVGSGYPNMLFARLTFGLFKINNFGLDLGVVVRSDFFDTQVGLRPRLQFLRIDPFALGLDFTIMGGGGPTKRNSFTFEVGPIASLAAGQYVHFNFKPYLGVWSDRLCPAVGDIKDDDNGTGTMTPQGTAVAGSGNLYQKDEYQICKQYDVPRGIAPYDLTKANKNPVTMFKFDQQDPRERFVTVRFMLQVSIEIAVSRAISIWLMIEGAPFQAERQSFTSKFNSIFPDTDFPLYGGAGITGKF